MVPDEDGPERYSRADLVADARYLAQTLEDAHPDPYTGHGGRVAFHRRLEEAAREIPEDGESVDEFYHRVAELAARVRDGHTDLSAPESVHVPGRLAVRFRVVGRQLYVDEVYDNSHRDLLGGRLVSVEGVPTATLLDRVGRLKGADNRYQEAVSLALALRDLDQVRYLVEEASNELTVAVESREQSTVEQTVVPVDDDAEPVATLETTLSLPETDGRPVYQFLDDDRRTAVLALPDMFSYREAMEQLRGMSHDRADQIARDVHERVVDGPIPDDPDEVVAALPSAIDILTDLATEMAAAGTERLVIDTRANTGGNSLLGNALTYVLHGWDGILTAGEDHVQIPKHSSLYRDSIGDDGPVADTDNHAGFDFGSYFEREDASARQDRLSKWLRNSETFAAELESGEHEAHYCPESVVVVAGAMTYSAGAEPAFTLSQLGATVVGVPPSQAPNVPRDALTDELPNTGLEFRTAYRHVESRPDIDGRVFQPDVELTPERFETMGRPGDAGIRLALEVTSATD